MPERHQTTNPGPTNPGSTSPGPINPGPMNSGPFNPVSFDPVSFNPGHTQSDYQVRCEWGPTGAAAVTADLAVVVDVLSFTTTLGIAVQRGIEVWPFRWKDERAEAYAAAHDATLAVGRLEATNPGAPEARSRVSLSPASIAAAEGLQRLVLPSPNGSTISAALADTGARVLAASLRNADAVAEMVAEVVADVVAPAISSRVTDEPAGSVVVVPAGERWADGSLRPCVEDLWGAGAVIAGLVDRLPDLRLSPEARVAELAWRAVRPEIGQQLRACAGGRELSAAGFANDVEMAAEVGVDRVVPELCEGRFTAAER